MRNCFTSSKRSSGGLPAPLLKRIIIPFVWACLLAFSGALQAQTQAVSGRVTSSEDGAGLPGVNVTLKGSQTGTITDANGAYTLNVPEAGGTLVFSSIGYLPQTIESGNRRNIDVVLAIDTKELNEVVVTAFGIEREKKALGTSVTEISGKEITEAREVNVANSLAGKVAGVQVNRSAGGPGASSRVIIRGNASLTGNNQPLYVIDGIPMDNSNTNAAGRWGGNDFGDGISNINPDDIESMTVLKGPNAAALYGQRGANGVILITTKKGTARKGIGVSVNSNTTFGTPLVMPDFQNEYGLGNSGTFRHYRDPQTGQTYTREQAAANPIPGLVPQLTTLNDGVESPRSWGPRMDGTPAYTWYGELRPFSPQPDNMRDFYQTERTFTNTVSLTGGNENTTFYLSLSNLTNRGLLPTNTLDRNNINLRATHKFTKKFSIDAKANYINQNVVNRPGISDAQENTAYTFRYMPRNEVLDNLKQYEYTAQNIGQVTGAAAPPGGQEVIGFERHWTSGTFTTQPYWAVNKVRNEDTRERVIGYVRAQYDFTDWLTLSARSGTDFYTDRRIKYKPLGTRVQQRGELNEDNYRVKETNSDILLTATRKLSASFDLSVSAGANRMNRSLRRLGFNGTQFKTADLYTPGNLNVLNPNFEVSEQRINSVYGFGQLGFKDYLFLDWTARNDWSSTLPLNNSSFFYPSLSTSFVLTDAIPALQNSKVLSFAKLRASWAQAGNSGDPYQLVGTYNLTNFQQAGRSLASFTSRLPLADLKNELTTSVEAGTDIRLFGGRGGIDFTYYQASTKNQIIPIDVSPSTGYASRVINAGEILNRGVELLLSATPVKLNNGFQWDMSFNFTRNYSEVVELAPGVQRFFISNDRNVTLFADPGRPYGTMYANSARWLRDAQGNRLIDPDGLPVRELGLFPIGNVLPQWLGGFTNTFTYKNLSLSSLIDIRQGGIIFSMSNVYEAIHGTTKRTLAGREGDLVAEGVKATRNADGTWTSTGEANDIPVRAEAYWNRAAPGSTTAVGEEFVNDASFVAMRELNLSYRLPQTLLNKTPFTGISLSLVGRNLFYFSRHTDGFAPEAASFNVGNTGLGYESASLPFTRQIGFNINLGF
jgi:TonB-linked SusC/RagA family outer membrane protein